MKKNEVMKILNKIKSYYPNQFFLEDYIVDTWIERLQPYTFEDGLERLEEHLKDNPTKVPQPHIFTKGMLTPKEKEQVEKDYIIDCNLCGKTILYSNYEEHYKKCLLCKALELKAQESNKDLHYNDFTRIPYEKLNSGYGHLFEHKLTTKEMLERII